MDQNLNEQEVHQIEEELHVEIVPGTEIMTDVTSHHFVKSSSTHHDVLVPQPSDDKHDPLNWSPRWKFMTMFIATFTSFTQGVGPLALAPMFPAYIEDFNSNLEDVIQFTGIAILVLGFSNFVWIPILNCWGRRPCLILSTIVCLGAQIWRAQATSYGSFMGASILNGFGGGPAETVMPVIVADIMFLHERGKFNTLYFATYFGSLMIGPIIAGPMTAHVGWRSFWWLNVALCGVTLVLLVFAFPETRYHRPDGYDIGKTLTMANHASNSPQNGANTPGGSSDNVRKVDVAFLEAGAGDIIKNEMNTTTTNPLDHVDPWLGRGTPAKWQWKLWQPYVPSLWKEFLLPLRLLLFPIIEFAAFSVSWAASAFLTINLTQSQAFAAPPYNFSSETIGFFNFAVLIGAMIGLFTAGPLSDYVAAQLTRRNRGIREPEMRLLTAIPYVVLMVIGNVITAIGYDRHWHWAIIVVLGWTCTGIQVAALPSIFSTYAVDSYKPVAGAIFVTITVNKNVWGYGFSRFITAWAAEVGFITPIMTNMALILFFCSLGIVFWFYGKTFRRWTKDSNVHHEKQM